MPGSVQSRPGTAFPQAWVWTRRTLLSFRYGPGPMWRSLVVLAAAMTAVALGLAGCGDSGPEGPNAGFVEDMEELGVSREQAEKEAREIDRQVARESRRQEAKFQRELKRDEKRRAREGRDEERGSAEPTKERSVESNGGFTGKYAQRYEEDRIVCGLVPHSQIAREFGIASTSHPLEVAEAYAEGFYGRFEQAAFEGCFDGIEDRLEE